ncbi:transcriptional regulator [Modestobacter sp. I12A-02628]|uniref:Helix-turn-helix transcriptional regulator n=1 Tax=Goekera deserti TaxID=2497753 RepID=A0A7K3WDI1_9ACTN|nr:helix-turn-helix domain-containing protein [Goekera deserti]MPQ97151.1 transcriptional regulator [Goekera deserti]NDI46531.1 transcriptional regulator [Goekera deserti]NEL54535.1 helix-turn-helix transcriptional regulator [Goekera deserti]
MDAGSHRPCSVAATLETVGERWSLLVVRELFYGVRRFEGIRLATGAPRNMLAVRLRTLEDAGVLERRQYSQRPPRFEYHLTPAGQELVPVLLTLQQWGDRHLPTAGRMPLRHRHEGHEHRLAARLTCTTCGEEIVADDLSLAVPDPWATPAPA